MPEILNKSQIVKLSQTHLFKPRKRFGQNFLVDKNIIDKIVNCVVPKKEDFFMEIGSGFGALTFPLLQSSATVVAYEIDRKLCRILKEKTAGLENVKVVCRDFLKVDFSEFPQNKKIRIIGNLPYCITSLIIEKLVAGKDRCEDIHIMTQKEFARRLTALPKSGKEYSSITLFASYHFLVKELFLVKKTSFWPQPEVDSVFLRLKKRSSYPVKVKDERFLFDIIRGAFGKRRKTISNSLLSSERFCAKKEQLQAAFEKTNISPRSRAEELSLEDFIRLANAI